MGAMFNKKLNRQLKKNFNSVEAQEIVSSSVASDLFVDQLVNFLKQVSDTYQELDDKFEVVQKNLELSSLELVASNKKLFNFNQTFDAILNSLG